MFMIWIAVVIGIVEGLTEFLPVSSTGHMILVSNLFGLNDEKMKSFEVVIQLGAILAVTVIYWRRILRLFGIRGKTQTRLDSKQHGKQRLTLVHIFIAILPAGLLGFLFNDFIKEVLFNPWTVLIGLVLGGIFLIAGEQTKTQNPVQDMDGLSYRQALYVGLAQILSLWPGFSRSGATIAGGMMAGASRAASADFTFLIAIPIMCAATGYEMLSIYPTLTRDDIGFFATGFLVSFVVALLAVVTFIKLVQRLKLTYFAYYRFVLAAVYLIYIVW